MWVLASYRQIPGRWVVAAACHQVTKGQELTDSYGPTFMEEERDDRRKRLFEDYRFPCRCLACFKKWPCTPDLAATIFEVLEKCQQMCVKYLRCQKSVNKYEVNI